MICPHDDCGLPKPPDSGYEPKDTLLKAAKLAEATLLKKNASDADRVAAINALGEAIAQAEGRS